MKAKNKFPLVFFLLAYLFTWTFQIPVVLDSQKIIALPFPPQIFLLASIFGPFAAAFFLTWREKKTAGVWRLFKKGFDLRFSRSVYLFVAVVPLFITFFAFLAAGGNNFNSNFFSIAGTFIVYFFLGGSFGEEFGWRGFALPRLLQNYNPLIATLILGILWSIWHLPLFWLVGTSQFYTPIWLYFIYVTALAFQYTWIFLRTNGNLFACLLLHTFTNISVEIFPIEAANGVDQRIYYETLLAVVVALILVFTNYRKMISREHLSGEKHSEKEHEPEEDDEEERRDDGEQAAEIRG
jgi:membrane protease YdiL (CAAX protease family)